MPERIGPRGPDANEFEEFREFDIDPVAGLLLDINASLQRLDAIRSAKAWHGYYRNPLKEGMVQRETLIVDQYRPDMAGKNWRIIVNTSSESAAGRVIETEDYIISTLNAKLYSTKGQILVRPGATHWPLGKTGPPIIRSRGDSIDLISGSHYDHFPHLHDIEPHDDIDLKALARLESLAGELNMVSYEPYSLIGTGEF